MTALVQAISRVSRSEIEFTVVVLLCAGLSMSLMYASYGLDLSAGFF